MTQPTLSVLDSSGTPRVINTANPNGQTTAANSLPVVLASDQTLPLPAGAATNASLVTIGNTQHTDLQALLTAVGITNTNVTALTASQHADLLDLLSTVDMTNAGVATLTASQHADLQALLTAIGATNTGVAALTIAQHADLVAILTAIGVTNTSLASLTTAQHADLVALLAKVPGLPTGSNEVDRSGSTAVANTAQSIMAANAARKYFELQNLDATNTLYFRKDGNPAVVGAVGTFALMAGALYSGQATGSVSVVSTASGHKFSAVEVG
jgi:hypothetical protein